MGGGAVRLHEAEVVLRAVAEYNQVSLPSSLCLRHPHQAHTVAPGTIFKSQFYSDFQRANSGYIRVSAPSFLCLRHSKQPHPQQSAAMLLAPDTIF